MSYFGDGDGVVVARRVCEKKEKRSEGVKKQLAGEMIVV